jgi:hypothetical protein
VSGETSATCRRASHLARPVMRSADAAVPIPVALAHLPVVAGMAVPWVTPPLPDGRHPFGVIDQARQATCLRDRLCQVCGKPLGRPIVFLVRDVDLERGMTAEPGLHPACAWYSARACPMVAGRMDHYRASARNLPGVPAGGAHPDGDDALSALITALAAAAQSEARRGRPAEPWSAAWVSGYDVVWDPATRTLHASFPSARVLKVRPISNPQTHQTGQEPIQR